MICSDCTCQKWRCVICGDIHCEVKRGCCGLSQQEQAKIRQLRLKVSGTTYPPAEAVAVVADRLYERLAVDWEGLED